MWLVAFASVIYCIFMLRLKKPVTAILTPIIVLITTFKFFSVVPWPIYILVEFMKNVL